MKTNHKDFDCVRMKREIQEATAAAEQGLTAVERMAALEQRILEGPFADIWRARNPVMRIGEKAA